MKTYDQMLKFGSEWHDSGKIQLAATWAAAAEICARLDELIARAVKR